MGFFKRLFASRPTESTPPEKEAQPVEPASAEPMSSVLYDATMSPEERERVAVFATAAVTGGQMTSRWHIKNIQKVDMDAVVAILVASAVICGDNPKKRVIVKRIERVNQ
ncbi:MAG: hypothetical protein Q4A55_07260 [Aerococcus sp.]|nr:hypothetical protein [Aerococcus sp.]